jgi:hypothetical protein
MSFNKKEVGSRTTWERKGSKKYKYQVVKNLNPVTRKWQVYATNGSMEIKDYGNFGLRSETEVDKAVDNAKNFVNRYVKGLAKTRYRREPKI